MEKFNVEDFWLDNYWKEFADTLGGTITDKRELTECLHETVEYEENYKESKAIFKLVVPEVKKEDLNVSIENNYLIVELTSDYTFVNKFKRKFYIKTYSRENVKTKLENGVLEIVLEKKEEEKPVKIKL